VPNDCQRSIASYKLIQRFTQETKILWTLAYTTIEKEIQRELFMKVANNMLELIGNIPLVRLNRIGVDTGVEILVKPEFLNPSGSIKDRIAKCMIEAAEKEGLLKEGFTIVEASTGNTGIALSFVAAIKGYKILVYLPRELANPERVAIMSAFGCEVSYVDSSSTVGDGNITYTSSPDPMPGFLPRRLCLELESKKDDVWWARQR
jgi:cysteine synthase